MAVTVESTLGGKLTWNDYLDFPEDGRRHEIVDGEHYVTATPALTHQRASKHVHFQLYEQIERQGKGEVFAAPTAVQLSDFDVVEPDLLVVSAQHDGLLKETRVAGPPDLVVEILSPSSRRLDRKIKLALYQRAGVHEYWIIDPVKQEVEKYRRRGNLLRVSACSASGSRSTGCPASWSI